MIHWVFMVLTSLSTIYESNCYDNSVIIATNRQFMKNLSCYSCSSLENPLCLNVSLAEGSLTKECNVKEKSCSVTRIEYENSNHTDTVFWALERVCLQDCVPGCIILGERTRLHFCRSCCSEDLCNISSKANSMKNYPLLILLYAVMSVFKFQS